MAKKREESRSTCGRSGGGRGTLTSETVFVLVCARACSIFRTYARNSVDVYTRARKGETHYGRGLELGL